MRDGSRRSALTRRALQLLAALLPAAGLALVATQAEAAPTLRIGAVYAPGIELSDASRTGDPADVLHAVAGGTHNLGAELSLGGGLLRYHLTGAVSLAASATGLRVEPATLGFAIPLFTRPRWRLEVEPTAMLANVTYLEGGSSAASIVALSAGADVRANLAYGHFFVALSPLGFDVRYAAIDGSAAKARAFAGGAATFRLRLFVGVEF
ncbi:MAG: hypothetical protein IPQ09_02530 [Myxococcales bacterium]|nr:hypothetical protein [Myxococcales bacterium]HQY59999.1 hypothetical protein [Polyangiaceae bacterium]